MCFEKGFKGTKGTKGTKGIKAFVGFCWLLGVIGAMGVIALFLSFVVALPALFRPTNKNSQLTHLRWLLVALARQSVQAPSALAYSQLSQFSIFNSQLYLYLCGASVCAHTCGSA